LSKRPLVAPSLRSMSARRFARKRQDVLEAQVYAGIGGLFLTSFYPGNRFPNFTRNAADFEEGVKRMIVRRRGGQPGNQNAVKHGRFSAPVRAARRKAMLAVYEESRRKS